MDMRRFFQLWVLFLICTAFLGIVAADPDDITNFDWRMYLELNPDLLKSGIKNEASAKDHFVKYGRKEGRQFPGLNPFPNTFETAKTKLDRYIQSMKEHNIPEEKRTIIIYHVGRVSPQNNLNVTINSMKIFMSSLIKDHIHNKLSKAFYWINIINGTNNQLYPYIPQFLVKVPSNHQWNVGLVHWSIAPSDMYMHFRTLDILNVSSHIHAFRHTIILNNDARGPLAFQDKGEWIEKILNAFRHPNLPKNNVGKVGIVGSALSCEVKPHVQTHFFAIDNHILSLLLNHYRYNDQSLSVKHWLQLIMQYEVGLSQLLLRHGYFITALMYQQRLQMPYFDKKCVPPPITATNGYHGLMIEKNPVRWCGIEYNEVIFLKWGGTPFRKQGMICTEMLKRMNMYLYQLQDTIWQLKGQQGVVGSEQSQENIGNRWLQDVLFTVPEVYKAGSYANWYNEFKEEEYKPIHMELTTAPMNLTTPIHSLTHYSILNTTILHPTASAAHFTVVKEHVPIPSTHLPVNTILESKPLSTSMPPDAEGHVHFVINTLISNAEWEHMTNIDPLYVHHYAMTFLQGLHQQSNPHWTVYFIGLESYFHTHPVMHKLILYLQNEYALQYAYYQIPYEESLSDRTSGPLKKSVTSAEFFSQRKAHQDARIHFVTIADAAFYTSLLTSATVSVSSTSSIPFINHSLEQIVDMIQSGNTKSWNYTLYQREWDGFLYDEFIAKLNLPVNENAWMTMSHILNLYGSEIVQTVLTTAKEQPKTSLFTLPIDSIYTPTFSNMHTQDAKNWSMLCVDYLNTLSEHANDGFLHDANGDSALNRSSIRPFLVSSFFWKSDLLQKPEFRFGTFLRSVILSHEDTKQIKEGDLPMTIYLEFQVTSKWLKILQTKYDINPFHLPLLSQQNHQEDSNKNRNRLAHSVFHHPAPTYCLATGSRVWYHTPTRKHILCIASKSVDKLLKNDLRPSKMTIATMTSTRPSTHGTVPTQWHLYDWHIYEHTSDRHCLRYHPDRRYHPYHSTWQSV